MTLVDDLGRQVDFLIDDIGVTATLTSYTQSGSHANYLDSSWSSSSSAITVFREERSVPRIRVDAAGEEREIRENIFCKDTVTVARDPQRPVELIVGNATYEVIDVEDMNNGVKNLVALRMR